MSFSENRDETVEYFDGFIKDAKLRIQNRCYYFDIARVTDLTSDAVMYILGLIDNLYANPAMPFRYRGNEPAAESAKKTFRESGFFNYVQGKVKTVEKSNNKMQIVSGNTNNPSVAQQACDFVNNILGLSIRDPKSKALYELLIEIIGNVKDHAYARTEVIMRKKWYLYAEKSEVGVRFVFLDTGVGIPSTIKRKLLENVITTDGDLIEAAFTEQNRSGTKLKHRGNGLPTAYKLCKAGFFNNFTVFSGKGRLSISTDGSTCDTILNYDKRLFGTIICWEVR